GTQGTRFLQVRGVSRAARAGRQDLAGSPAIWRVRYGQSRYGHQGAEEISGGRDRPDPLLHADGEPGPRPYYGFDQVIWPLRHSLFQIELFPVCTAAGYEACGEW